MSDIKVDHSSKTLAFVFIGATKSAPPAYNTSEQVQYFRFLAFSRLCRCVATFARARKVSNRVGDECDSGRQIKSKLGFEGVSAFSYLGQEVVHF